MILLAYQAHAIAIANEFLPNNTILLGRGQSTILSINIQNPDPLNVTVKFAVNSDVAKLMDSNNVYEIPAGKTDTKVYLNITAPKAAKIGDTFDIKMSLEVLSAGSGAIPIGVRLNKKITLTIYEKTSNIFDYLFIITPGVAIFITLSYFVWMAKRNEINIWLEERRNRKIKKAKPKNIKKWKKRGR